MISLGDIIGHAFEAGMKNWVALVQRLCDRSRSAIFISKGVFWNRPRAPNSEFKGAPIGKDLGSIRCSATKNKLSGMSERWIRW